MRGMSRLVLAVVAVLLIACSGGSGDGPTNPVVTTAPTQPAATQPATVQPPTTEPSSMAPATVGPATAAPTAAATPTDVAPTEPTATEPAANLPLWQTAELRDVRTGQTFRVADFTDKVVVVEPMAIWCSNCRAQQDAAREALAGLPAENIVYVSLDVDPNETEPDLATYADERGYPWMFAVASIDVARSLAQTFGDQVLSPPSTPKILVVDGSDPSVSFGYKSAAELSAELGTLAQ
jgi:hypothetical protein